LALDGEVIRAVSIAYDISVSFGQVIPVDHVGAEKVD